MQTVTMSIPRCDKIGGTIPDDVMTKNGIVCNTGDSFCEQGCVYKK